MRVKPFFLLVLASAFFLGAAPKSSPQVRVLISENQKSVKVSVKGSYTLKALPSEKLMLTAKSLDNVTVEATKRGIKIGSTEWPVTAVRVEPKAERDAYLGKARFRGVLDIQKDKSGTLSVINRLEMEDYLYGVLPHEVASWWPMEALKAQAIAARTYAFYQMQESKGNPYDVKNTTSSQVYGGSMAERYRTKIAINQTAGKILKFQDKVFPAYFHATCGGYQAGAQELWKINLTPIAGGAQCTYCRISPHFYWEAKIPLAEVEEKLNANGRKIGQLLSVEIVSQTPSHRAGSLKFTGNLGEAVIAAKDFRVWMGGNKIRSTAFTVETADDMALFHGKGWGHGVGLCQWGGLGQALVGRKYQDILKFYYPSSAIEGYETERL